MKEKKLKQSMDVIGLIALRKSELFTAVWGTISKSISSKEKDNVKKALEICISQMGNKHFISKSERTNKKLYGSKTLQELGLLSLLVNRLKK